MSGLFWEMHQQRQIRQADHSATRAKYRAQDAQQDVKLLEQRLEKLTLVCMAMWELLAERTGVKEDDLMDRMHRIDMQDGKADGKVKRQIAKCRHCGRTMSPKHARCLYCGSDRTDVGPWDSV